MNRLSTQLFKKGTTNPLLRATMSTKSAESYKFETLAVSNPHEYVYHVEFNRPEKRNAMNFTFVSEMISCFNKLKYEQNCRAIVLSGKGKIFSSGLDLTQLSKIIMGGDEAKESEEENTSPSDPGRRGFKIRKAVEEFQEAMSSVEKCSKPVIACVHSACVGGGVNLISACDIRYCTSDAWFSVKEVELGIAADIGALQRMPKTTGNDSLLRELIYTARPFNVDEAKQLGLVSRVFNDYDSLIKGGLDLAQQIASKSPIAVQGSKVNLIYSRDHTVDDGLKFISVWNMSNLQSEDLMKAAMAAMSKEKATFSKL